MVYAFGGKKVYAVNGEFIRNSLSKTALELQDFTQGGNHKVYPNVIPKDEYWVDDVLNPIDFDATALHEIVEPSAMGKGRGKGDAYEIAHTNIANPIEFYARAHPENLKRMINSALRRGYQPLLHEIQVPESSETATPYIGDGRIRSEQANPVARNRKGDKITGESVLPVRTYLGHRLRSTLGVNL